MRDPSSGNLTLLRRGFVRRCPRCGTGDLFPKFLSMHPDCPGCGHHFERDHGYWIGAMIVATAFTLAGFLAVFVGGMVLTWPDVPWNVLLLAAIAVTAVVPLATYSTARTLWVSMDLAVRPLEHEEIELARRNRSSKN